MSTIRKTLLGAACLAGAIGLWYVGIGINLPHSTWIREYKAKDPQRDASGAWDAGDHRFKGIYGDGLSAPGLGEGAWYYPSRYGVDGIRGTSDCFTSSAQREFQDVACEYATRYNAEILRRVRGAPSSESLQVRDLIQNQGYHVAIVDGKIAAVSLTLRALRDAPTRKALLELGDIDHVQINADIPCTDADLDLLSQLTNLTSLDVSDSPISDSGLDRIAALTRLEVLMLGRTHISDAGLAKLKLLTRLKVLHLHATGVTDAGMDYLLAFRDLESLYLLNTKVTDVGLAPVGRLERLKSLDLNESCTDQGLLHLTGLRELRYLGTRFTQVTPQGVERLRASCPKLVPLP